MSRAEFYPYPIAEGALHLTCRVEDERVAAEDHRLLLQGIDDSDTATVHLELSMDDGVIDRVVSPDERDDPPVKVLVLVQSLPSRTREAVELNESEGVWSGTATLVKSALYEAVSLEPVLARTKSGTDEAFATHAGARIASGAPTHVEIDEPPVTPGGYLEVKWDDFAKSEDPRRKVNPDLLYVLDTDADPPMLWLNSGTHEDFKPVMHASGPRGRNMRVRDAMYDTIVSQAWTSLVSIVITRLATAMAEEENVDAALEALTEWETRVLHYWAPSLEPEAGSKGEAVRDVAEDAASRDLMLDLQDRLGMAVQRQSRTAHAFQGLIRLRDLEGV